VQNYYSFNQVSSFRGNLPWPNFTASPVMSLSGWLRSFSLKLCDYFQLITDYNQALTCKQSINPFCLISAGDVRLSLALSLLYYIRACVRKFSCQSLRDLNDFKYLWSTACAEQIVLFSIRLDEEIWRKGTCKYLFHDVLTTLIPRYLFRKLQTQ